VAVATDQQWLQDWLIREVGISVNAERGHRRYPASVRTESMVPKALGVAAERQKAVADAAAAAGHNSSALRLYEAALRGFVEAQHNLFTDSPLKRRLMTSATQCMDAIIALARHRIERVDIPFEDGALPAVVHEREGGGPLLFYIPGMDGTKEASSIGPQAAAFLARGFRVFAMDGPGQGAARTLNGVRLKPGNYLRAVRAALDHLKATGRWDGSQIFMLGSSLGTRWGLEAAAADRRIAGLALVHSAFGRQLPLFYSAPPRFRKVLAFMTGLYEEDALRAFVDATELPADMQVPCPTLVFIGEYDPLCTVPEARTLYARNLVGPRQLFVLGDSFHGGDSVDALGGLNTVEAAADWLADRAAGRPMTSGEFFLPPHGAGIYDPKPLEYWHTETEADR
jgi:pimeloyl-ACP methyl ester carboxylesterase